MKTPTDPEIKQKLSPQQYRVMRGKETEAPFTGELLYNKASGMYVCAFCGKPLFTSDTKFDSDSGWPSFYDIATKGAVKLTEDKLQGARRVEVSCANCGGHLGHVFNDAPDQPTGMRFCINSCALDFRPKAK